MRNRCGERCAKNRGDATRRSFLSYLEKTGGEGGVQTPLPIRARVKVILTLPYLRYYREGLKGGGRGRNPPLLRNLTPTNRKYTKQTNERTNFGSESLPTTTYKPIKNYEPKHYKSSTKANFGCGLTEAGCCLFISLISSDISSDMLELWLSSST